MVPCHDGAPAFDPELWDNIVHGIRAAAPNLRDLEVYIRGTVDRRRFLNVFGTLLEDQNQITAGTSGGQTSDSGLAVGELGRWELPGKLVITFVMLRARSRFTQVGSNMVRMVEV